MGFVIAIAGKGGTGKTTITASLIRIMKERRLSSILAIDADPNSNLAELLGVKTERTIGSILDEISAHPEKIPQDMSKDRFLQYQVLTALSEEDGFDILTMGRPEGPGCYCYVNNVLRGIMGKLVSDYKYVIIDNEAGLEHFSRRTTRAADCLVIVSDAAASGLRAAQRMIELIKELKIPVKKSFLLINRLSGQFEKEKAENLNLAFLGSIPQDKQIEQMSLNGNNIMQLDTDALSLAALRKIGDKIWQN
jgi:CO dehydrogenase maturation factor